MTHYKKHIFIRERERERANWTKFHKLTCYIWYFIIIVPCISFKMLVIIPTKLVSWLCPPPVGHKQLEKHWPVQWVTLAMNEIDNPLTVSLAFNCADVFIVEVRRGEWQSLLIHYVTSVNIFVFLGLVFFIFSNKLVVCYVCFRLVSWNVITDIPQRYCRVGSRPPQYSESNKCFGFPVHIKICVHYTVTYYIMQ